MEKIIEYCKKNENKLEKIVDEVKKNRQNYLSKKITLKEYKNTFFDNEFLVFEIIYENFIQMIYSEMDAEYRQIIYFFDQIMFFLKERTLILEYDLQPKINKLMFELKKQIKLKQKYFKKLKKK